MNLYMNTTKAWMRTSSECGVPMTEMLSAVLVPQNQSEIPYFYDYLELLAQRIEWMIKLFSNQKVALELIEHYVDMGGMSHALSSQLQADSSPWQWASALTEGNAYFQDKLNWTLETRFPVPVSENPQAIETVRETSLESWLQIMAAQSRSDWM